MRSATKHRKFSTLIPVSMETIIRFHEQRKALSQLTPPPLIVQITADRRISLTEGTVDFRLWFGPVPVRWLARHEPGPVAASFIDRMLVGPLAEWEHQHIFLEASEGVQLVDRVSFAHKSGWRGWLSRLLFDGPALHFLFWYRHWRTRRECRKVAR